MPFPPLAPAFHHSIQGFDMFRHNFLLAAMLAATLATTGCASKKLANQDAFDSLATAKAEQFAGDSEKALDNAEQAYKSAKDAELDFYAPLHMEQLRDALKQARALELEGKTTETVKVSAKVVTLYEGGLQNKQKAEGQLPALIQQKATLDEIKANNVLPGEYKAAMDDFKELISLIETGDEAKAAKDSEAVLKDLQAIELDVMLTQHWQPAKKTLDKAEKEDADSNATKTFEYAENLVQNAERIIRQSYTDRELVEKTGKDALRAAQHALFIGREVATLVSMNKAQAETVALQFEDYLGQIGSAIKADDVRHMSLQDQTLALKQFAEEQNARVAAQYKQQIANLNAQIEQITNDQIAANEKAAAEKAQLELEKSATQQPANISITVNQPAQTAANGQAPAATAAQQPAVVPAPAPAQLQQPAVTQQPVSPPQQTPVATQVAPAQQPIAQQPVAQPVVQQPAPQPVVQPSVQQQPQVADQVTEQTAAAPQPAPTQQPVAQQPVVQQTAVQQPTVQQPAAQQAPASQPQPAPQPAAQQPVVQSQPEASIIVPGQTTAEAN